MIFSYLKGAQGTPAHYVYDAHKKRRNGIVAVAVLLTVLAAGAALHATNAYGRLVARVPIAQLPSFFSTPDAEAAAKQSNDTLQGALENWAGEQDGEWGMYVIPAGKPEVLASWRIHSRFAIEGISDLFLLKPTAQSVAPQNWDKTMLNEHSYGECIELMLAKSDKDCKKSLTDRLGLGTIHYAAQRLGYKETQFNKKDVIQGSVADTGLLLERLYQSDGYDQTSREKIMAALQKPKKDEAIREACTDCRVYNKTADANGVRHDAALVIKNDRAYVVVIFSKDGSWPQMAEAAEIINRFL